MDTIHYGKHEGRKGRAYGRDAATIAVEGYYAKQKGSGFEGCDAYSDYRELCARDDIDAVLVATPDNWHALAAMEALQHGKDVYCEKPVTHLFAEGQALYQEVAKRKAIFQTGSQQRSTANFHQAVELIQNGVIGKVQRVEVGKLEASNPEWVAKELNLGPKRAYKAPEHHRNFIDGVKTRTECVAPAETAHRSITPGHIAYVSQALGRKLKWDPAKEEVVGDAEAQKRLMALPYRAPWRLS